MIEHRPKIQLFTTSPTLIYFKKIINKKKTQKVVGDYLVT